MDRFALSLLFGDESGEGEGAKLAEYLDQSLPNTKDEYRSILSDFYKQDMENTWGVRDETSFPRHAGRLYFYPTYFKKMNLEVINPHSRITKAGTNPIQIETVPAGEDGRFCLFFASIHQGAQAYSKGELIRDLYLVIDALHDMFHVYGIGAKTSSGFGAVEIIKEGRFQIKLDNSSGRNIYEESFSDFEGLMNIPATLEGKLGGGENADGQ